MLQETSSNTMTTTVEHITPEIAKIYLATSTGNRALRPRDIDKYIRDLKNGKFVLTHQGIAFDEQGHLGDGHHRLTAIALSGVSADMMVTRNMPREYFAEIDNGLKRGFIDTMVFQPESEQSESVYARNAKTIAMVRKLVAHGYSYGIILSNDEIKTLLSALDDQIKIIYHASITRKKSSPAAVSAAGLAALLCGESEEDINSFFDVFANGETKNAEQKNIGAAFNWNKQIMEAKVKKASFKAAKLYSGTQNAIWNYCHTDETKIIRPTTAKLRYPVNKLIAAILNQKS